MGLYLRMVLYLVSGVIAGQGLAIFDAEAGTITFRIDDLVTVAGGAATFVATFLSSRVAKAKGGAT
jgi:hypothetical protein